MKHIKHCDPLVKHRETLAVQCDNIDARYSDNGACHGDIGAQYHVSGDCGVGITPQMCP